MLIPMLMVGDVTEAITFYTGMLDFELVFSSPDENPFYAVLARGKDELHLNRTHEQSGSGRSSAIVVCEDVDTVFAAAVARGLGAPTRANSPVHKCPLDQTWGTREVYIDDPSGNTIIYQQRT
jgi:catechol 2,3-dioxygenase-like lactoylglutathione lyase family enzyme